MPNFPAGRFVEKKGSPRWDGVIQGGMVHGKPLPKTNSNNKKPLKNGGWERMMGFLLGVYIGYFFSGSLKKLLVLGRVRFLKQNKQTLSFCQALGYRARYDTVTHGAVFSQRYQCWVAGLFP